MTVDRALTAEERRLSQTAMRDQSFLSSLAMNCGSETLLILLALSLGIPAVCICGCKGTGCHTREEKLEKSSLIPGCRYVLDVINGTSL